MLYSRVCTSLETRPRGRGKAAWGILFTRAIVIMIANELSSNVSLKIELAGAVVYSIIQS